MARTKLNVLFWGWKQFRRWMVDTFTCNLHLLIQLGFMQLALLCIYERYRDVWPNRLFSKPFFSARRSSPVPHVMFQWQRSFHPCPPCEFIFNIPFAIASCSFPIQSVSTQADYLSSSVSSLYCFVLFIMCFIYLY